MGENTRAVLAQAMILSEAERAELAGVLLESLEPSSEAGIEAAWRQEVAARVAALDSGAAQTVPWAEVRSTLFASLSDRRPC